MKFEKASFLSFKNYWNFEFANKPHNHHTRAREKLSVDCDDHLIMSSRSDCRVALRRCLAIIVRKEGCQGDPGDFWMYESGYLLFQGLLSANSVCWWNSALNGATKNLVYRGYVNPGAILVASEPCALEILRGAWARRVLQPPAGYQIVSLEDIEDSVISNVPQTQWTPLPEAICAVVLRLSSQGRPAGIPTIREALIMAFPHVSPPSERVIYDTLVQLTSERKLYHSSRGYFIVTPERRRSRSHSRGRRRNEENCSKTMLMSTEEALVLVHGDMATIRDGDVTHQCIQTNLADVICGGNTSDKIMYARNNKRRSASFPSPKSPDRRGSFRLWGSSRRLRRSASTRTLARHYADSSSSTEYPNSSDSTHTPTPKKESLLSRIFRRSKRSQCQISSFSAQFPPTEWFNSKAIHLHNVGTQTSTADEDSTLSLPYYYMNSETNSSKSATLPRRHRRQLSNDSTYVTSYIESRDQSPSLRYGSPSSSTLPRNPNRSPLHSMKSRESSRKTSRSSLTKVCPANDDIDEEEVKSLETKPIQCTKKQFDANFKDSKASSLESLKTSQRGDTKRSFADDSSTKTLVNLDNSGPSSIESHKSSKTGSSATSGPSSLESHKTVISRNPTQVQQAESKVKRSPKRRDKDVKQKSEVKSSVSHSNSFTLQVTTNQNGTSYPNSSNNATTTTTINSGNGANTKIFVQNSPVRSVITFENGQHADPNLVIINGSDPILEPTRYQINPKAGDVWSKNTNTTNNESSLNNSITNIEAKPDDKNEQMNNSRKLSLQMPSRDLNYKNFLKNVPSTSHDQFQSNSNPDSPINNSFKEFKRNSFCEKPFESIGGSAGNVYKQLADSKTSLDKSYQSILDKNILGSEPNISVKDQDLKTLTRQNSHHQFPSLSDLSFNFTSLAAQKILKGVSINSIDTLVELNMAATTEKQNNCDIVHTDFGLV